MSSGRGQKGDQKPGRGQQKHATAQRPERWRGQAPPPWPQFPSMKSVAQTSLTLFLSLALLLSLTVTCRILGTTHRRRVAVGIMHEPEPRAPNNSLQNAVKPETGIFSLFLRYFPLSLCVWPCYNPLRNPI
jgi:hypothetical protein